MTVKMRHKMLLLTGFAISVAAFNNCSKAQLSLLQDPNMSRSAANFCTVPSTQLQGALKYILIIDRSGSNNELPDVSDPNGDRRFPPMIQFVNQNANDPNIFWSMINLGDSGDIKQKFDNNKGNFITTLTNQYSNTASIDNQWTNYIGALQQAQQMISDDIKAAQTKATQAGQTTSSTYVIFFVTDGVPVVNGTLQSETDIINTIGGLESLAAQNTDLVTGISVNTALYYSGASLHPDQTTAPALLKDMANAGHGSYLSFSDGQVINYNQFAVPVRNLQYENRQVWVENTNIVWENGTLKRDSDGDGLSDELELKLGSNPNKYDSDGNGVSDGVEYALNGKPCQDSKCGSGALSNPYTACLGLRLPSGGFADIDKDGLNDCEETLLGTSMTKSDTNGDLVPDLFAFRHKLNMTGPSQLQSNPTSDGMSNYQKLLQGLPLDTPLSGLREGYQTLHYVKGITSSSLNQSCYNIDVSSIPTLTDHDVIRIYIVDSTDLIQEKEIVRMAQKPIVNGEVQFVPSDFNQ